MVKGRGKGRPTVEAKIVEEMVFSMIKEKEPLSIADLERAMNETYPLTYPAVHRYVELLERSGRISTEYITKGTVVRRMVRVIV